QDWNYKDLVEIFHQLGIINNSKKKTLLDFNNGRNHAVHHLSHPTRRYLITRKELGIRFRQGIIAYDISKEIRFICYQRAFDSLNKKPIKKRLNQDRKNQQKINKNKNKISR
ncbi:MAG: hypothetical protein ACT4NJ_05890, partial [Nitrosopumilaceae archaeon]